MKKWPEYTWVCMRGVVTHYGVDLKSICGGNMENLSLEAPRIFPLLFPPFFLFLRCAFLFSLAFVHGLWCVYDCCSNFDNRSKSWPLLELWKSKQIVAAARTLTIEANRGRVDGSLRPCESLRSAGVEWKTPAPVSFDTLTWGIKIKTTPATSASWEMDPFFKTVNCLCAENKKDKKNFHCEAHSLQNQISFKPRAPQRGRYFRREECRSDKGGS